MARITVKIKNGKVITEAEGYKGSACVLPINNLLGLLNGDISQETITPEGMLHDDPISCENSSELSA
jgi:hypothetical protein